jgi:DNA primase
MAIIPEDKLLEIKDAAALEEVIGQYVKLQQRGKNLVGLCPFHADTQPSFTVAPDKGIFHCFGCGAGGNVFSFLMQYHKLSFPEAVQELAKRYGIPLTFKDLGPEGAKAAKRRQGLEELTNAAAAFFAATLKGPGGQAGREYLIRRGLTKEVIQSFHLGYAPDEWDALSRHLQNRGFSPELAQEAGLVLPRDRGGYYDRFRNRVIFPIEDRQGKPIAFGGRIIGEGEPKYLNSPESPLYTKGRHLYGLPQAAEALRQSGVALVVEGYLDLLALRVHGVANVLATLGTALTKEQVRLLRGLVPRVVLVFDGDAAGARAMRRAFPLFGQEGLAVRVLPLPPGMDPDNYVNAHGPALFAAPWEAAQPWFAYLLEDLVAAHGLEIDGRVAILEELLPYFRLMGTVEKDLWLKRTAERMGVGEASLRQSLASLSPLSSAYLDPGRGLLVSKERQLIRWVLRHPQAITLDELEDWANEFEDADLKQVLAVVIRCYQEHGTLDHSLLIQQLEEESMRQHICALTLGKEEGYAPSEDLVSYWRQDLRIRCLKKARAHLKEQMESATARGGGEDLAALLAQRQEIDRQLEALKLGASPKGENG